MNSNLIRGALLASVVAMPAVAEEPVRGGTLRLVTTGEPSNYDCHAATSITAQQYLAPHYSTLMRFDQSDYPAIHPDVATAWTVSDDLTRYSVTLREGITFHDGSTLDAEDVAASFRRMAWPEGNVSARVSQFAPLSEINVTGPYSLEFVLSEPSVSFLNVLASPWNCIYSAELLAENPDYPERVIMGSGPFLFEEHVAGASWSGTRNPEYYDPALPYLDAFRMLVSSGPATLNAMAGGQVDANLRLMSVSDMQRIREARGDAVTFQTTPVTSVSILTINTTRPPFDDVRVRRALSLAIDRHLGVSVLGDLAGQRWPHIIFREGHALSPVGEDLAAYPGYGPDVEAARAEARALLAEAGQENLRFTLLNRNIANPYEPLGIYLIDQWRQIGVEVEMETADTGVWTGRLSSGDFDVSVDLNAPVSDEPTEVLLKYLPGSSSEYSGIEDARLVELYAAQDRTADPEARAALVREFVDRVVELQYVIPTFNAERNVAFDSRLKGWQTPPTFYVGIDLARVWWAE